MGETMESRDFIHLAIQLAVENVQNGGGPFGAVVAKDGKVVATGTNQVTATVDPTAHAEVVAIRNACRALGSFELSGCDIYCSCEPCPMCLGAIYWSRPARVFFAAPGKAAADAGFDDSFIREQSGLPYQKQSLSISQIEHQQALSPFAAWKAKPDKVEY
jgi:tRNA(Arg) A34 adenosine deaminase TadA